MKHVLRISDTLSLPLDWITLATVVYGGRGSGKTTLGAVMAEEVNAARQRFGAIDLKGDWWGLKSTADGRSGAIPVIVFGGDHADVPLEEDAGAFIGETVAGMDQSFILDLENLSKGKQTKFLGAFFTALYHHTRDPLLMFLDEAQRYAPQKTWDPESAKCLGAVEDLVKLGRKHGIGLVVITQRGAGLNKEISELCDMLVACRTPGPLDQERVADWLDANATLQQRNQVIDQLSGFETGTALFASGHPDLKIFGVYPIRRRETFDSSATPRVGQRRIEPKLLAKPDLEALRTKMSAAIERAKAEDPKALWARIRELEKKIAAPPAPAKMPALKPVPVITKAERELLERAVRMLEDGAKIVDRAVGGLDVKLRDVWAEEALRPQVIVTSRPTPAAPTVATREHVDEVRPIDGPLPSGARTMLETLGRIRKPLTRHQLATLSGMSPNGGTFRNNLSILSTRGYIEKEGKTVELSSAGATAVPVSLKPLPLHEVLGIWRAKLPSGAVAILDHLVAMHPRSETRAEVAAACGMEPAGGTFRNNLSILSTNGLLEKEGSAVRAGPSLFIGGR